MTDYEDLRLKELVASLTLEHVYYIYKGPMLKEWQKREDELLKEYGLEPNAANHNIMRDTAVHLIEAAKMEVYE